MVLIARFPRLIAFLIILGLWPLSGGAANAQTCHVDAPRYSLQDDIVTWSMTIVNGRSCIRGLRFSNVQFGSLKLVSPPQFGEVVLEGAGFVYSPNADFHGRDAFSLLVIGVINGKPGSSTIQVTVSDNSSKSRRDNIWTKYRCPFGGSGECNGRGNNICRGRPQMMWP